MNVANDDEAKKRRKEEKEKKEISRVEIDCVVKRV